MFYIFDAEFSMPPCYTMPSLTGSMLADNAGAAYLNNNLLAAQSTLNGGGPANFTAPPTSFNTTSFFQPGVNTLDFLVEDHSTPQVGLQFSVSVTYQRATCGGTLKICKVAGVGVSVGTSFTFNYTVGSASGSVNVPAGPAPGGYCVVVGTFPASAYKITENLPSGNTVSSIKAVPAAGTANLSAGTFSGKLKVKIVTEVTYTDQSIPTGAKTGYLEICKNVAAGPIGAPSSFTFTVDGQTVTVPTNACSSAIDVVSGVTTVTESPVAPFVMTGCSAIPAINLVSCNAGNSSATVTVDAGAVSAETILTVTNTGESTSGCGPGISFGFTSAPSTTFTEGGSGSFVFTTCGGTAPISFSEAGALPAGVSFADNGDGTATLAGTAAAGSSGTYPITVTATDSTPNSVNQSFTLTVT